MNFKQIQGLNTLRFFAFFAVFIFHSTPFLKFGYLGVDFFFILSSFLLTYLALNEIELASSFSRKKFFIRRSLRIYPLYFAALAFCFTLLPIIANIFKLDAPLPQHKWLFFFFLGNYEISDHIFTLKLLWSIAVEEQFYVLFLLLSYSFKKNIWVPVVLMLTVFYVYQYLDRHYTLNTYSTLFGHLINFCVGISLATFYTKKKLPSLQHSIAVILFLAVLLNNFVFAEAIFKTLVAILFAFIIAATIVITDKALVQKFRIYKLFEYLGTLTYGLYVFSGFTIPFTSKLLASVDNIFLLVAIELMMTIALAWLSFTFFERRFIKLKEKFK